MRWMLGNVLKSASVLRWIVCLGLASGNIAITLHSLNFSIEKRLAFFQSGIFSAPKDWEKCYCECAWVAQWTLIENCFPFHRLWSNNSPFDVSYFARVSVTINFSKHLSALRSDSSGQLRFIPSCIVIKIAWSRTRYYQLDRGACDWTKPETWLRLSSSQFLRNEKTIYLLWLRILNCDVNGFSSINSLFRLKLIVIDKFQIENWLDRGWFCVYKFGKDYNFWCFCYTKLLF